MVSISSFGGSTYLLGVFYGVQDIAAYGPTLQLGLLAYRPSLCFSAIYQESCSFAHFPDITCY
jgi:hypothetical protein